MIKTIAKTWTRILAFALDVIILGIIGQILGIFFAKIFVRLNEHGVLIGFLLSLIYFSIGYSKHTRGQTIGKKALGIKVTNGKNEHLNIKQSIFRGLLITLPLFLINYKIPSPDSIGMVNTIKIILFGLFALGNIFFLLINKPSSQALHDIIIGSYVVDSKTEAENSVPLTRKKLLYFFSGTLVIAFILTSFIYLIRTTPESSSQLSELSEVRRSLIEIPQVIECSVSRNVRRIVNSDTPPITSLILDLRVNYRPKFNNPNSDQIIQTATKIAFQSYKSIEEIDNITVRLVYGFNIGIAKRNFSISNVIPTSEIKIGDVSADV